MIDLINLTGKPGVGSLNPFDDDEEDDNETSPSGAYLNVKVNSKIDCRVTFLQIN